MATKEPNRKMVEANLRSVTQSCKDGVPLDRLERDYLELLGTAIPYRELGFTSLESMIRGMPDVLKLIRNEFGKFTVMGVADETTAHIASLVARQRSNKTRKFSSAKPRFRTTTSRSGQYRQPFANYTSRNRPRDPVVKRQPRDPVVLKQSQDSVLTKHPQDPVVMKQSQDSVFTKQSHDSVFTKQSQDSVSTKQPQFSRPAAARKTQTYYEPEPVRLKREEAAFNRSQHTSVHKPESRPNERWNERTSTSASNKTSFAAPRNNFEMPPRFRKQEVLANSGGPSRTAVKSPAFSNDFNNFGAVNDRPIPPPTQRVPAEFQPLDVPVNHQKKIPSPKPKPVKEKRKEGLSTPPLPKNVPPIQFVQDYAEANGLDHEFITRPAGQVEKYFNSVLKLDNKSYRSYPEKCDCRMREEAEEFVASLAMNDILKEESKPKFAVTEIETQDQIQTFVSRIEQIVSETPNGMWSMSIPKEYENKFSESLPINWLPILQQNVSTNIDIAFYDAPKAYVLRYISGSCASGNVTPSSTSSKASSHFNEDFTTAINKMSLERVPSLTPSTSSLEPSEKECWEVHVTFVSTTVNIAFLLHHQMDQFTQMSTEMCNFYQTQQLPIQKPVIGKLFAAHQRVEEQDYYYRVRVDDIHVKTNEVSCYFVDIGDNCKLSTSKLFDLDANFETLPFLAINVSLYGLEEYSSLIKCRNLVDKLFDKSLIAEIKSRTETHVTAVLYDTSGDEDVNLNDLLREITIDEFFGMSLPEMGCTTLCFLTSALINGEMYIRLNDPSHSLLETEMDKCIQKFEDAPPITPSELSSNAIYVTKYDNGLWYRTVFCPMSHVDAEEVELFYVDYGNSGFVPWKNVKSLENVSPFLASLPHQAIPCTLHDLPPRNFCWTENAIKKLYELAPEDQELIVKVLHPGSEVSVAEVELFKRNRDGDIISVNHTISLSEDLFSQIAMNGAVPSHVAIKPDTLTLHSISSETSACDIPLQAYGNNSIASPSVLWAPTPDAGNDPIDSTEGCPPPPEIPEIGQLFDVYITYVASPSNFVVQSLRTSDALSTLINDMKDFYQAEENLCEMHHCLLKPEKYYAALHSDELWYRVKVKNIDEGEQVLVAVHFIDFGDFNTVSLSNLQPLYQQFKTLPCQAIKASLHGVKPIYTDWLPEQCFEVKQLMNEKQLVGIVKDKTLEQGEWTLSMTLVDTTLPNEDVYLHELLVERELAATAS